MIEQSPEVPELTALDAAQGIGQDLVPLLKHEPDLAEGMSPERFREARGDLVVEVENIAEGRWKDGLQDQPDPLHLGYLVLEGMITREIELCGRESCELLGPGHLLRPWQSPVRAAGFPVEDSWTILRDTRLAVLDRQFAVRAHRYPEVGAALLRREVERARWLEFNLAVTQIPQLEMRLLFVFSYLAEFWGQMNSGGIEIPIPLNHDRLAALAGVRRPSVTTGLGTLADEGLVKRADDGCWELTREFADFSLILEQYDSLVRQPD